MNLNFRGLVYSLRRQWGRELEYIQILESTVNDRTGKRDIKKQPFVFPAIDMPADRVRKFIQDIGYLAANKNFTYGSLNDYNSQKVFVCRDDLPVGLDMNLNGYVIYGGKRYEKLSFNQYSDIGYMLVFKGVEGAVPYAIQLEPVFNRLELRGRATFEVN